ncbi:MAG: hypothetical protein U0359_29655 [Byssovorax sp.]
MPLPRSSLITAGTLLSLTILAAGCSSGAGTTTTTSAGAGGATGTGGAGSTTSAGSGGGGGEATITTIARSIGPITAQSGMEGTQCITVNLNNPEGAYALRLRTDLSSGSHHMIVYTSDKTVEELTPTDCQPFAGILNGEHPLFIAQQPHQSLDFPVDDGKPVGFEIKANQMVKIEMHFIDTGDFPLDIVGKVSFDTVPLTAQVIKSDLAFWGTTMIDIPANGTGDTGVLFQRALAGTKTFALTTHQHQLGKEMRVWYGTGANDPSKKQVADSKSWSDPPLELFAPPLDFPGSGKLSDKGFAFQCQWQNNTPKDVHFGEGFNDEMCFLWHFYYPSQGFQMCLNGACKTTP